MESKGSTMRLKQSDQNGPLSVLHNGNENTGDSVYTQDLNNPFATITTATIRNEVYNNTTADSEECFRQDALQWCNTINTIQQRQQQEQPNNKLHRPVFNINTTLASLRPAPVQLLPHPNQLSRDITPSSICSESPDDSLLDFEVQQSSVDSTPQDEDRGFDLSDTDSEEGNVNLGSLQGGIVNPNYPGFQHLAHTLEYAIKASSDTDFTDDDLDSCDINNINNNNASDEVEFKIDSVNKLDSVENIQKVFYDKPKLNIPLDVEKQNNCQESCSSNEDLEENLVSISPTLTEPTSSSDASGDFTKEQPNLKEEDPYLTLSIQNATSKESNCQESSSSKEDLEGNLVAANPNLTESILSFDASGNFTKEEQQNLEKSVGKLTVTTIQNVPSKQINYQESIISNEGLEGNVVSINPNLTEPILPPDESGDFTTKEQQNLEEAVEKLTVTNNLISSIQKVALKQNNYQEINTDLEENLVPNKPILTETISYPDILGDFTKNHKNLEEAIEKLAATHNLTSPVNFEQPELKMADIKMALVTSTEELTTKLNQPLRLKAADAFLSEGREAIPQYHNPIKDEVEHLKDSNRKLEKVQPPKMDVDEIEKFCKEDKTKDDVEKDEDSAVPRKKEKMEINYVKKRRDYNQQIASLITIPRREFNGRNRENLMNRRSAPVAKEKKRTSSELFGGFDVYNIETAMPKIDLDAIESHLRAAREEERRRRTDREEIRRRLAMGSEDDYYSGCDRPGRKPSLQARLQSGMNLQICFMNETASDTESPNSDTECTIANPKQKPLGAKQTPKQLSPVMQSRPVSLPLNVTQPLLQPVTQPMTEADFFARQARLQTEARMALAQAKEMAHMQMEVERQLQKKSPITEMVRSSLEKVGIPFPEERRRVSRQILTEMNVAQLQVIVNDLHTQIETLNENLVRFLMNRDDLHMEQDSMLVDIEDLTRYLGAKEQTAKEQKLTTQNTMPPPSPAPASPLSTLNNSVKPRLHRIASLVKK